MPPGLPGNSLDVVPVGVDAVPRVAEAGPSWGNTSADITGSPRSNPVAPVSSPIEAGSNFWSWGKNPSAKRFQPARASVSTEGETVVTYEIETSCTRVGVAVL